MIDMTNFKKSVKWYDENLAALLPQYRGKYVGVCIDKVCGSWDNQDVGFDAMVEAGKTYLVQIVEKIKGCADNPWDVGVGDEALHEKVKVKLTVSPTEPD